MSTTLMDFIVDQSSLPVGNIVRDHIENPGGGGVGQVIGNLDGTVITTYELSGTVIVEEISATVIVEDGVDGQIVDNNISGTIEINDLEGKLT